MSTVYLGQQVYLLLFARHNVTYEVIFHLWLVDLNL